MDMHVVSIREAFLTPAIYELPSHGVALLTANADIKKLL